MTRRTDRVNGLLRQEMGTLLLHELRDPRLARLVSITQVSTSPDLRHAKVFVSVMGSEEEKRDTMVGLRSATPFVRRELGSRLALRFIPELRFMLDESIEEGDRVLRLMDRLHQGGPRQADETQATRG
jgi:ribosome-binding factor A